MVRVFPRVLRCCVLIACCSSPIVWAQAPSPPLKNDEEVFRQLDRNGDGKLTLNETGPASRPLLQQLFELAGKPNTGSINHEEFLRLTEQHRRGRGSSPDRTESAAPTESGLRINRSDLRRALDQFTQLDRNRDGFLDSEELQAAVRTRGADGMVHTEQISHSAAITGRNGAATRNVQHRLAGVWRGWIVEGQGENANAGQMQIELRIEGNRMTFHKIGGNRLGTALDGLDEGTFMVSGNGATGNLDASGSSGPQQNRQLQGIYQLNGDTLRWCVAEAGRPRPTEFRTGHSNYLLVLRRDPVR